MTSPVLTTARAVLDPGHARAALRVNPADATAANVAAALRCGTAVGLALAVPAVLGHQDLAGFSALGALASLYGRFDPYRRRAAVVALLGAVLTGAFAVTATLTTAGTPAMVTLVAVAAVAAGASVLCVLLRLGPPGGTIVVFAAAGGMAGSATWTDVGIDVLAVAAGAVIAWLVATSGYLVRPHAPARLAVDRAVRALDRARSTGTPADVDAAQASVAAARRVLADDASHRRTRPTALVLAADLARLVTPDATDGTRLPARPTLRGDLRTGWSDAGWRSTGLRVSLAAIVAGGVAQAAGLGHSAWAQMGATATLQGTTTQHAVVRALQRATGTAVGALLAWPLLAAHLDFAATCAVVVGLQVVTEVIVGRHYGLAMLTITPMALLMTSLAGVGDPAGLASARALDTVVGAAFGVLAVVLVHPRSKDAAAT